MMLLGILSTMCTAAGPIRGARPNELSAAGLRFGILDS